MTDTQLRERIRGSGLRCTPARLAVLRMLADRGTPVSHPEIVAHLSDRGWDRATLYRNLADLTEVQLLRKTDVGDHVWRYELRADEHGHVEAEHPHFVCTSCGEVSCLPGLTVALPSDARVPKAVIEGIARVQLSGECDVCEAQHPA
jgi:Fur family ferric uptake transcriptional regulator